MASRTFRDRFFSPPVGRALTSPSGILALGAGAAVGILATLATGGIAVPVAGILGGLVGYGGRLLAALPPKGDGERIDAFGINEPWRHAVRDAQHAQRRFEEAVQSFRKGPLRDTLSSINGQLDDAVEQVWQVAKQGQAIADARKRIDDRDVQWQLQQTTAQIPVGGAPSAIQAQTINSLTSQLESAGRMDALIRDTNDQLALLNARLDESVTQAIELSVAGRTDSFEPVGANVGAVVDSLTSLRQAMTTLADPSPQHLDLNAGQVTGQGAGQAAPPPPAAAPAPALGQTLPPPPDQASPSPGS